VTPRGLVNAILRRRGDEIRRRVPPPRGTLDRATFVADAQVIRERHRAQTRETVAALQRRYDRPVFGRVETWTLIERLAQCVDPTDATLGCSSQLTHVLQVLQAMEAAGVEDPDLLVAAVVHDLGKLLLLTDEAPENVVCMNAPIGEGEPGTGLDRSLLQWNHDELAYRRLAGYVPEAVAWLVRYHSLLIDQSEYLMDARDRAYTERYLRPFRRFDQGSKSAYALPRTRITHYRDLVEAALPRTLVF